MPNLTDTLTTRACSGGHGGAEVGVQVVPDQDDGAAELLARQETDADTYLDVVDTAETLRMSAANYLEAAVVIDSARDPVASRRFGQFITEAGIQVEPVTLSQAGIARDAYRDYGKGSGHKTWLNFGDCFAYALAKEIGVFKGEDFSSTDITAALDGN